MDATTPPSRSRVLRGNARPDALRPRDAERLAGAFHAERGTRGLNAYYGLKMMWSHSNVLRIA